MHIDTLPEATGALKLMAEPEVLDFNSVISVLEATVWSLNASKSELKKVKGCGEMVLLEFIFYYISSHVDANNILFF